jgi:hypothetical protein
MYKAVICIIAAFLCTYTYGAIGKLTEVTGPTQIVRSDEKIDGQIDIGVEMNDTIETLKARVGITFEDNTRMQITEYSKLKIDEFIYDPSSKTGSISVKAAFGTVRYASGLIAKNSRENVRVTTPTAKVSVRGTDFSMTVSEDGRSLIVLLPSIPLAGGGLPVVGRIEVSNLAGTVVLTQAYQATLVTSAQALPSIPVILDFQDESKINNMLIVDTPKSVTQSAKDTKKNNEKQVASSDDGDSKPKKAAAKTDTKTQIAQVDSGGAPPEEATDNNASNQATEEPVIVTGVTTILDINALQPGVLEAISSALSTPEIIPSAELLDAATKGSGFISDNVIAILSIERNGDVIRFVTKANANVSATITNLDGTATYNLNFADKSKVNITQKK